jgi:hypothetical protein
MPYESNWLSGRRENQLAMSKNWFTVLGMQEPERGSWAAGTGSFRNYTVTVETGTGQS